MLYQCNYFIYDIETGGLDYTKHPIIEIAIIGINEKLEEVFKYENYVKPYNYLIVEPGALKANGINMDSVYNNGIEVRQLYEDLKKLFKQYKVGRAKPILVGHNIYNFDNGFVEYVFDLFEKRKSDSNLYNYVEKYCFDTIFHARQKTGHIDVENYKLGTVCRDMGVELIDAHRAMNDTQATRDLFIKFIENMRSNEVAKAEKNTFRKTFRF